MFLYIRIVFVLLFSYFERNSCEVPPADRAGTLGERISGEDAQRVFLASCDCHCQGYPVIRWPGIVAEQVDRSMTDEIMLIMGTKAPQQQQQPKQQYPIPVPSPASRVWLALRVLLLSMMYRFGVATLLYLSLSLSLLGCTHPFWLAIWLHATLRSSAHCKFSCEVTFMPCSTHSTPYDFNWQRERQR